MKIKCAFEGCHRDSKCKSYCDMHYRRLLHKGDVNNKGSRNVDTGNDLERFHKKYIIDEITGCWNWTGSNRVNSKGIRYGRHFLDNKTVSSHRYSFSKFNGKIIGKNFV